ncbi:MAG: spermidine/putrescine ABC transporter substrate-binding protein [Proteobacteria bacterium]|nr:spermidine/putrescine ABC transporter substrate-binding protein [Pseudomonadota bacterium]
MTTLRYLGWEGYADGDFAAALRRDTSLDIAGDNHLSDDAASRLVQQNPNSWDIININTPFVRAELYPRGLIRALPAAFDPYVRNLSEPFARFEEPATGTDGNLIGVPQRCGPFNLVINENRLSRALATEQGFRLTLYRDFHGRFGILTYEDFNIMHIAIAAGLNPFQTFTDGDFISFSCAARDIFQAAKLISDDHNALNRALVEGVIDFYISGGTYTASPARLAGHSEIRAVTPANGPINGKGGVAFVEINALIHRGEERRERQEAFLTYIASDEGAYAASLAADACNPVVQMQRASVFERFTRHQLDAMQWDDFEENMARCADYAIMPDYAKLAIIMRAAVSSIDPKSDRNQPRIAKTN